MSIIDEIKSYFGCGSSGKALAHYGTPRHSGRYPWGSGENPFQHSGDFLSRIDELKKSGMTETEIAHELGLSTTQYRVQKQLASHERRQLEVDRAKSLRADGKSLNEIAKIMGYQYDSSVRSLLNDNTAERANRAQKAADILKKELKKTDIDSPLLAYDDYLQYVVYNSYKINYKDKDIKKIVQEVVNKALEERKTERGEA